MAKEGGEWSLSTTVTGLSDYDLEHIAEMIIKGFTSGEIVEDEEDEED